ncbi:MAG: ABC transporter permease [Muribaculaceae bacterium]|nr:ABC transporter permease [Muribaculaceae bacterium]MDE7109988.1 ABC transporter permease [Muribaculaceae bacterium]
MIDLFHEIVQVMSHNKLRTALTGIAVTWGIFMLIVLLSMARGVTNSFDANMSSRNMAIIKIWGGQTSIPYKGNREGRRISFRDEDMQRLKMENSNFVDDVTSVIDGGGVISTSGGSVSQTYSGVFPSLRSQSNIGDLTQGRFITAKDMEEKAKVMVLPQYYASQLFPPDGKGALGGRVICSGLSFLVVGVYESERKRDVYIPFTTARMMSADRLNLGSVTISLKNVSSEKDGEEAEEGIKKTLASIHNFDPADDNAVYISNYYTNSLSAKSAMGILDVSVWVLGILTLLTGIVGVSNIMFVTVRERTHEIGVRRAIGAKPVKILTQVITESVAITLLFGYLGIVLGMVVSQVIAHFLGNDGILKNPTVSLSIAFEVMAVLVVAGALAGLFPALKALKVKPVEALRDE